MRLAFILCLLALTGLAQPVQRNPVTTNLLGNAVGSLTNDGTGVIGWKVITSGSAQTNWPLSSITNADYLTNWALLSTNTFTNTIVSAGSNVFVTPSLSGQTRTYTVDVPTNAFPTQRTQWAITDITNSLNLTNWALLTTNAFTNVIVAAGSNAFVTPSLSGQVRTYTVDVPTQSGGGSSNITDSGYIAVIRNANVQTNLNLLGSNYITGNFTVLTNQNQIVPDFSIREQLMSTNAAFTFLAPVGVDATKTEAQWTLIHVTNTTATAVLITSPANCWTVGTPYVTNWTDVYFNCYAQKRTNAFYIPVN